MGRRESGAGPGSSSDKHTPPHLRDYYFVIQRLVDGKPVPDTEIAFPYLLNEGQRYDFLTDRHQRGCR